MRSGEATAHQKMVQFGAYILSLTLAEHLKMDGWKLEDYFPFRMTYFQRLY